MQLSKLCNFFLPQVIYDWRKYKKAFPCSPAFKAFLSGLPHINFNPLNSWIAAAPVWPRNDGFFVFARSKATKQSRKYGIFTLFEDSFLYLYEAALAFLSKEPIPNPKNDYHCTPESLI
jgi:hypothetical protein